jgi:hypothetical protein
MMRVAAALGRRGTRGTASLVYSGVPCVRACGSTRCTR